MNKVPREKALPDDPRAALSEIAHRIAAMSLKADVQWPLTNDKRSPAGCLLSPNNMRSLQWLAHEAKRITDLSNSSQENQTMSSPAPFDPKQMIGQTCHYKKNLADPRTESKLIKIEELINGEGQRSTMFVLENGEVQYPHNCFFSYHPSLESAPE